MNRAFIVDIGCLRGRLFVGYLFKKYILAVASCLVLCCVFGVWCLVFRGVVMIYIYTSPYTTIFGRYGRLRVMHINM